jgi:energy-coupling factor transport system ATP-binding protein
VEPVTALSFDRVAFDYDGVPVLRDVSFTVTEGQGVALFGPNGAGKTTVTRLAMGLLCPGEGRVTTVGRPTAGLGPEDLADVAGYLFQQPAAQLIERTVRSEIAFGPKCLGWPTERIAESVESVLDELDLSAEAETHPYDLPLALRRIVALGSALVGAPRLLLLDEPTAALDRNSRGLVVRVVRRRLDQGVAVLAVTHDTGFAIECLDRSLVLGAGAIANDAPTIEVLSEGDPDLPLPPVTRLARALDFPVAVYRTEDVARELAHRCRSAGHSV